MDILVVSSEIAPYSRWTIAGDACAALPKALRGLGHKVSVLSPLWASIDPGTRHLARRLVKIELEVEGAKQSLALFDGRSAGGVELQFLANEALFPRSAAATDVGDATAARWGAFARAAIELLARRDAMPDVVHLVGWQTAAIAVLMKDTPSLAGVPTVLSIPDATQQGLFDRKHLATFGIAERWWSLDGVEFYGKLSTLKAGIQAATRLTTSSPSYAREVLENAGGLEGVLRTRGRALVGILDGVDVSVWNAATDPWLESRFDPMDVVGGGRFGKHRCKTALQKEMSLPVRDDVPLVSAIGTVAAGTGLDRLADIGASLARNDLCLAIAAEPGSDPTIVGALVQLASRWPDRIAVRADADAGLVHRALGASDLGIVPEDPSGARAMQGHRYGALPIARRAGGVADAVVDCDAKIASGTGFLYDEASGPALLSAVQRGLAAYTTRDAFRSLQHRVMTVDHSWERSARLYERVYRAGSPAVAPAEIPV